jgi:hypothetical protein
VEEAHLKLIERTLIYEGMNKSAGTRPPPRNASQPLKKVNMKQPKLAYSALPLCQWDLYGYVSAYRSAW